MLHLVHQGIGPIAIASMVTNHYEDTIPGLTLDGLNELLSTHAWADYKDWCRSRRDVVSQTSSRFSGLRFNRDSWQNYPELNSNYKAAMVKYMVLWVASFLGKLAAEVNTESARLRANTAYSLARFQYLQEVSGPWLSQDVANEMCYYGRTFLLMYQRLGKHARNVWPTRRVYKLVPKFHCFLHACLYIKLTKRNMRYEHLYMDEDLMKQIGSICSRTHPSTMGWVSLCRYCALLELCELK